MYLVASHHDPALIMTCGKCGTEECTCQVYDANMVSYGSTTLAKHNIKSPYGLSLTQHARAFYGALAAAQITGNMALAREIIQPIAELFGRALLLSILGEARYEIKCAMHEIIVRAKPEYVTQELWAKSRMGRVLLSMGNTDARLSKNHDLQISRDTAGEALFASMKPPDGLSPVDMAHLARSVFGLHLAFTGTQNSVGGAPWYNGADLCWRYLSGKITPIAFVDQVFDTMHNGGPILNKTMEYNYLSEYLDFRQHATAEQVLAFAPLSVRKQFGMPESPDLPTVLVRSMQTEAMLEKWRASVPEYNTPVEWWLAEAKYRPIGEFSQDSFNRGMMPYARAFYTVVAGGTGTAYHVVVLDKKQAEVYGFVAKRDDELVFGATLPQLANTEYKDSGIEYKDSGIERRAFRDKQLELFYATHDRHEREPFGAYVIGGAPHSCPMCEGYDSHPAFNLINEYEHYDDDDEHWCGADTEGCYHDEEGYCCCIQYHAENCCQGEQEHDDWCVNYAEEDDDEPDGEDED